MHRLGLSYQMLVLVLKEVRQYSIVGLIVLKTIHFYTIFFFKQFIQFNKSFLHNLKKKVKKISLINRFED